MKEGEGAALHGPRQVNTMESGQRVHFIGIGGYGMSGLARVLLQMGFAVTGSDARPNDRIEQLRAAGARVAIGHDPSHVQEADVVVYSTDVPQDNVELQAARSRGLKVLHRSELLAEFVNRQSGIAVTGTHGKTTTSAMIALILAAGGLDPTALIGGEVPELAGNARLGRGPHVVAEADESDRSFLRYFPSIAVITNIEPEHLEHYGGDFTQVLAAYRQFLGQVKADGLIVACADDPHVLSLVHQQLAAIGQPRVILYGFRPEAGWTAREIQPLPGGIAFTACKGGREQGTVQLRVPGRHNVQNALAALAVGDWLGLPFPLMAQTLADFGGAKRRFQTIALGQGVRVVDDYAHHPTEIRATLRAAREMVAAQGGGRVVAVFQPQRYTRTYHLMDEFTAAFDDADVLILTEIYSPAGERAIPGVSSQILAIRIEERTGQPVQLISDKQEIIAYLEANLQPGDLVLTMGAGDIWQVAKELGRRLGSIQPA